MRYPHELTPEEIMEFEQEYKSPLDLPDHNTFAEVNAERVLEFKAQRDALLALLKEAERVLEFKAQRDALLALLKEALDVCMWPGAKITDLHERASAAIKAVEE